MKRWWKLNRVSWAPDVNLCQVKLFRKEDCPSEIGGEYKDSLQPKSSFSLLHSGMSANDLPPGFEGGCYVNGLKHDVAELPRIRWTCPRKFVLDFKWHVAAGEGSKEVEAQKLREMRVLEAVYPRLSVTPPSPSFSQDVEVEHYDDSQILLIPLTPIEDEECVEISSDFAAQSKTPSEAASLVTSAGLSKSGTQSMPFCARSVAEAPVIDMLPGVSSDVVAAVLAALTAVMKSNEQGSLIDTDLLIKILSDPKMVEKLINKNGYQVSPNGNMVRTSPVCSSEPETKISSLPSQKPVAILPPMRADRNSNLPKELQPKFGMQASRADVLTSMPTRVGSSIPMSGMEMNMISGHKAANGNNLFTLNQVQPALNMMHHVMPNSAKNLQPAISSTKIQLNPGPAVAAMKANPVKDANYFKNLIREHGRDIQEVKRHNNISQTGTHFNHIQNLKLEQDIKHVASKSKFKKHCIFFNKTTGCREGSNCPYLHEKSLLWPTYRISEAPSTKKMKLGREVITGRI